MTSSCRGLTVVAVFSVASHLAAQCTSQWDQQPGFQVQGQVHAMQEWDPDGPGPLPAQLVLGGSLTGAGGVAAQNVVCYEPQTGVFSPLSVGVDGPVRAFAVLPGNVLAVGGAFATAGGIPANGIATWNGTSWQALGSGVTGGVVEGLAASATGDLFVGGTFDHAGGVPASLVARWNGTTWSSLGPGLTPMAPTLFAQPGVRGLATMPNGDVVAIGGFQAAGATPLSQAASWDGTAWTSLNLSLSVFGGATAITPTAGGVVVAGSDLFTDVVRRWDGTAWTSLGFSRTSGQPRAARTLANGDLILGVQASSGGQVQRLRGGTWSLLGTFPSTGVLNACVGTLPGAPAEHFVFGGAFSSIAGVAANSIASWNGLAWSGNPPFFDDAVNLSAVAPDGTIYVGGNFTRIGNTPIQRIARFDGTTWSQVGAGLPTNVVALTVTDDGALLAGLGNSTVWRFDGTSWSAAPSVPYGTFVKGAGGRLAVMNSPLWVQTATGWQSTGTTIQAGMGATFARDGSLLACGYQLFPSLFSHVARWNGTAWIDIDPTYQIQSGFPYAIAELPNGEIVVGGDLILPARGIVRRIGTTWQPMGNGLNGTVLTLAPLADGSLLAIGQFTASGSQPLPGVARWDGTQWLPFHGLARNSGGFLAHVTVHPAGDLLISGTMTNPAPRFARLRSSCPAAMQQAGAGCAGSGGANRLVAESWPTIGTTCVTHGSELPANSFVLSVLSVSPTNIPLAAVLPEGQPGCILWVTPDAVQLLLTSAGRVQSELGVPLQPALLGVTFLQQLVPCELGALGGLQAVTATAALALTIGSLP